MVTDRWDVQDSCNLTRLLDSAYYNFLVFTSSNGHKSNAIIYIWLTLDHAFLSLDSSFLCKSNISSDTLHGSNFQLLCLHSSQTLNFHVVLCHNFKYSMKCKQTSQGKRVSGDGRIAGHNCTISIEATVYSPKNKMGHSTSVDDGVNIVYQVVQVSLSRRRTSQMQSNINWNCSA